MPALRLHFMRNAKNVIKKVNNAAASKKAPEYTGAFFIAAIVSFYYMLYDIYNR